MHKKQEEAVKNKKGEIDFGRFTEAAIVTGRIDSIERFFCFNGDCRHFAEYSEA